MRDAIKSVHRNHLFGFFQMRDYFKKGTSLLTPFSVSGIENQMFFYYGKHTHLCLIQILRGCSAVGIQELGQTWNRELGVEITGEMWENIWSNTK